MSGIVNKGLVWGKRALMLKLGKSVIKRGGLFGIGLGAVAGAGYLAYNLFEKKKRETIISDSLVEKNSANKKSAFKNPTIDKDKTIII